MRRDDNPTKGLAAKKYLQRDESWWGWCDTPDVDAETGKPCVKISDSTGSIGDQFEATFLYLWMTDQARPLAALLAYSYLIDSLWSGSLSRSYCYNNLGVSDPSLRLGWLMTWTPVIDRTDILLDRIYTGIGLEPDVRTRKRRDVIYLRILSYLDNRKKLLMTRVK